MIFTFLGLCCDLSIHIVLVCWQHRLGKSCWRHSKSNESEHDNCGSSESVRKVDNHLRTKSLSGLWQHCCFMRKHSIILLITHSTLRNSLLLSFFDLIWFDFYVVDSRLWQLDFVGWRLLVRAEGDLVVQDAQANARAREKCNQQPDF